MGILNRLIYEPTGGQFREYIGINAIIEPVDLTLYQKFIPHPFKMPEQPVVFIFSADYIKVAPWPLTRYQEWAVLLKCTWDGEEGWYCITMPVTKWIPMMGGRALGFPKYVVNSISLEKRGQHWIAQSLFEGKTQLSMEFSPGVTRQLNKWEEDLISEETFFKKGDAFLLVPPSQGPRAQRVRLDNVIPARWSPEAGMVSITIDPNEAWAGLISAGMAYPGSFNHFHGGVNLVAVRQN